jgi:hypothetical protein
MRPQPIPSILKALVAVRYVLTERSIHNELILQSILFDADAAHVDRYGRQIYGERWEVSWHGPRGAIIAGILAGDRAMLSLAEHRDEMAMTEPLDPSDHRFMATPGLARLNAINMERPIALDADGATDALSVSDVEAIRKALDSSARSQTEALERLLRHPALLRSDGVSVSPEDMLDPTDPSHLQRLRRLREEGPSTHY